MIGAALLHGSQEEGVAFALDITKQRQFQEQFVRAREDLEVRVQKRTMELARINVALQEEIAMREEAQKVHRESEYKIRIIQRQIEFVLGATKTGLDIIDSKFNLRYVNSEWQKIYGKTEGRKCYEYFMGIDKPCPACGIPKALATKQPVVSEEILVRENNRPIRVTTIPFQDENGEWLVAEVNVDISGTRKTVPEPVPPSS